VLIAQEPLEFLDELVDVSSALIASSSSSSPKGSPLSTMSSKRHVAGQLVVVRDDLIDLALVGGRRSRVQSSGS
jgi:hypothetical protein